MKILEISRKCLKCLSWGPHPVVERLDGNKVTITCSGCGHSWRGRVTKDEV